MLFMQRSLLLALALSLGVAKARATEPDPWLGPDKAAHFVVAAGLAGLGYSGAALLTQETWLRFASGAGITVLAGVAKETTDLALGGTFSLRDMTWNLAGAGVGLLLAWGVVQLTQLVLARSEDLAQALRLVAVVHLGRLPRVGIARHEEQARAA